MRPVWRQNEEHPPVNRVSRKDFVRLCAAFGLGSAASPLLSACGRSAAVEPGGGTALNGGKKVGEGEVIAEVSNVEPGSAVSFTDAASGEQAVLLRLESGGFAAYSAICTHQRCIVAYDGEEGVLECPCHGSVFDPENGAEVLNGPAPRPLPEIAVEVRNGRVVRA